jgi:molybdenum cofactor cytidylyltransferase
LYVVLGHQNDKLSKVLNALNLTMVYNYSYRKGISSSIITGITMLDDTTDGVMICLADMPKISSLTYNIIIKIFNRFYKPNAPLIILPKFNNKDGNPVIFSSYFFSKLKKLNGDRGAKTLINKYKKYVKEVTLDDNSIIKDIDDITAYKELINDAK